MIQNFLKKARSCKGVVNLAVAITVTDALVQWYPGYNLNHVLFSNRSCTRSLLKRMKLFRRAGTTGKIKITDNARKRSRIEFSSPN